jgi:hypothetical protein
VVPSRWFDNMFDEGSGLMIELQISMEYEGYVSIQIKTSEFAAFLESFLLFSTKNQQMNGHIIIWRLLYYNTLYEAE